MHAQTQAIDLSRSTEAKPAKPLLTVNGIEVTYNHVILVLKGVSLIVPEGGIVALLGANGAGKTTTLRAISNLLHGERGEVTKGFIEYSGERIQHLSAYALVTRGAGSPRHRWASQRRSWRSSSTSSRN